MGGSLTIHNKTAITVKVTLANSGINHCEDAIEAGGQHDYDLARFAYDINVEGGDKKVLSNRFRSEPRTAYNVEATDGNIRWKVNPVRLQGVLAAKSSGPTKVFYITETQMENDEWYLILSAGMVAPDSSDPNDSAS